ncbi:hypothetical protein B0T26DRAFT_678924 [Lasiosphaeria miniovina]|uniref:Uncharacterized protein n=1 Tax=Lasiosphaeria miniovina TaxID=1954250 RepID=A0AA40DQA5_9PEZI|nr:uncharacterized protein B0T26DRAFT_678924 [Lasiosphaeria miniovina]KAK0709521.1 hypothetical protein B0T26DRAFT_678924 [Lasiosphaeria miniovina]
MHQSFYPINQGASRITIQDGQRYADVKEDITASAKFSFVGEASLLARVLDGSIGGGASLKGQRSEENVYMVARLETAYFHPSPSYFKQCLGLTELITGLKIAWGATVSTECGREFTGTAGADAQVPAGLVDVQVGAHAAVSTASRTVSAFGKPADFVLGIQVQKLYHKRAFLVGRPSLATKRVARNAVLADDEPVSEEDDCEPFTVTDLDGSDVDGFVPMDTGGEDEIWFVPCGLA